MPGPTRPPRLILATALVVAAGTARAADLPPLADEAVTLDVTNTAVVAYHFDNRNDTTGNPGTFVDDDYGELVDRLNVQLGWWRFRLGARFDLVTYFAQTSLPEARDLARAQGATSESYYRELNTRFKNAYYPSKLWLTYTQPHLEVTAGDFYAQLGRGFVLSVRKIDELAIDTTVRGGKLTTDYDFGAARVGATLLAGQLNPLRVEETSGRRLHGYTAPLFFGFPEAPQLIYYRFDSAGTPIRTIERARPSYLEDAVVGGHIEAGNEHVLFGANGSMLLRRGYSEDNALCRNACDAAFPPPANATDLDANLPGRTACYAECSFENPTFSSTSASKLHDTIRTFSGSVSVPSIAKHGDLYVEVAGQQLRDGQVAGIEQGGAAKRDRDLSGYAVYGAGTVRGGPATMSLEGKHYRSFFPLSANIDASTPGFSAPEFNTVVYNSPPTAEPIYVEPLGAVQVCNTGGRARTDYRFDSHTSVYSWLGHYVSFSEADPTNNKCDTADEKRTNTWDWAVGGDLGFEKGKTHVKVWVGLREDTRAVPAAEGESGLTDVFYREAYTRYDVTKHVTGPFAVQAQGFHRRRHEPVLNAGDPWNEGENYTALHWAPHFAFIFGYEYTSKDGCEPGVSDQLCHYFSGGLSYRSGASDSTMDKIVDTVSVFVGQRRGAIRCVSGVCRLFPPFEGARLELVSRF